MFLRSRPDNSVPDLHFMFIHVPFHLPTYSVPEGAWTIAVGLVRPASRGTLRLGADGRQPLIDPAYLPSEADVEALVAGRAGTRARRGERVRRLARPEALPGEDVQDHVGARAISSATPPAPTTTRSAPARWAPASTPSWTRSCACTA